MIALEPAKVPSALLLRDTLSVVLHQVRSPDNLGAVARLMANFGFARLLLSDPATFAFFEAEKLAVKGGHILDSLRVEKSLADAVGSCVYVCGTSSRAGAGGRASLSPEEAARRLAQAGARGPVALVFGGEKRGLSDDELALCQDQLTLPTEPAQPSMNLSQSVGVMLYLCRRAMSEEPPPIGAVEPGARMETVRVLEAQMQQALLQCGFLNAQAPRHILRELMQTLLRGELTQREAELWLTAFKQLNRPSTREE